MRVPLAWLRDYVDLPSNPQRIAEMLAQIGFPVDAVELRPIITGVVSGRIARLERHPNADRLQVGKIDVGNGALLTVATAATNVAQGQTIPVATIGAQLPQIKIERRKMRGLESEGMMISAGELALPPEWFEDGIMQLEAGTPLGVDLVEVFRLSEAVLDVDVTSNRVDAMSMLGLARELAAYQGVALRMPALDYPVDEESQAPEVTIATPDCRRYVAQRFSNVRVGDAPAWMRVRLALCGQRPINNIVDISNYVMLETGQPLHFYDDAKIAKHHLTVRDANPGEKLVTLDDQAHELTPQALVIADEQGVLGLAGLKGGKSSEIGLDTTAIVLESANFTGARIRRTGAQLSMRTEASTRHEKGLPLALSDLGAQRSAHLLAGQGAHAHAPHAFGESISPPAAIAFQIGDVKRLLGFDLSAEEAREYLDRLGFHAEPAHDGRLLVTPPLWRRDVCVAADIVEEIARMTGYDRIEGAIPAISTHDISSDAYDLETRIARDLCALGYREIATVAMHGEQIFDKLRRAGIEPSSHPVEILNPRSEDQRYLRYSLRPAMLEYFARVDQPVRVFELGHVFADEDGQPVERAAVAFGLAAEPADEPAWRDSNFLRIKGDTEALVRALTGRRDLDVAPDVRSGLHPGITAVILAGGHEVASLGRVDPRVERAFGTRLPAYVARIHLERIPEYRTPRYTPPSKYPATYRDVALLCGLEVSAQSVARAIARAIGPLCTDARAFDEYRGAQIEAERKSLAIRVVLRKTDSTITDQEADAAVERGLQALRDEFGVTLRT